MIDTHPIRWLSFEEEVRLLAEAFGYSAVRTPPTGDHGVDVIAEKNGRRVAIQVKLLRSGKVGNGPILALLGGMRIYQASEALLITTGSLTKRRAEACQKGGVVYYDRNRLLDLCNSTRITLPSWCVLKHACNDCATDLRGDLRIGRDAENDLFVSDDRTLSRRHCEFRRRGLALEVTDLGSANGTWVNEVRVAHVQRIKYGDEIRCGAQIWRVRPPD